MIYILLSLNFLLMIVFPLAVGAYIARRYRPGWGLFGIGAVTFVLSQVGHIPFNWLILQQLQLIPADVTQTGTLVVYALFLGLSAGVFEETARYLAYRFWAKDARTWAQGLMLGAGHGGIEAIIVGGLGLINFVAMAAMRNGMLLETVPPEMMPQVQAQIDALFNTPLPLTLLGFVERVFAIASHLAMSLLVLQVFVRGQKQWLFYSIAFHALLNATAVIAVVRTNPVITEGLIGLIALGAVGIIWCLRRSEPAEPEPEPLPELVTPTEASTPVVTPEQLDDSKFS